ncbi:MAG: MerR family transcriptional regulator, partial [Verrucomicrobia bacterium]|nr:MerR family transcriptional regulator [Verrucomicrobiota bacterium]
MSENFSARQGIIVSISAETPEPGRLHDLAAIAHYSDAHPDLIRYYWRHGLIAAVEKGEDLFFDDDALYWLRQIQQIRRESGAGPRAIRIILQLMREIEALRRDLR